MLGPNRGRLAFRRRPCRMGQNLVGQPVARPGEVGAGRDPRLGRAHQLLGGTFALFLGGGAFLIAACALEEGGRERQVVAPQQPPQERDRGGGCWCPPGVGGPVGDDRVEVIGVPPIPCWFRQCTRPPCGGVFARPAATGRPAPPPGGRAAKVSAPLLSWSAAKRLCFPQLCL